RWVLLPSGKGMERVVRFKTFKAAWAFMDNVAAKCKETRHHPEWTNIYNKTHIVWTTHSPPGLSSKDIVMAKYCDEAAAEAGEVEPTKDQARDDELLFTSRRMEANECCT
ncbi:transcriptional coactivator/pterin dehydratase, partial [Myriangium duriaei CBS 260.36]